MCAVLEEHFKSSMNRPPLSGPMEIGTRVVRGRDWEYGYQDGNPPGEGTVTRIDGRWVYVLWDIGDSNPYRMGHNGRYDLKLAIPLPVQQPASVEQNDQRLISHETQTEDLADAVVKGESLAHQNKKESAEAATQTSADDSGIQEAVQGCKDPEYTDFADLSKNFEELKGKDCDVCLEVGDKKFRVHKLILEERAPKLAAVISEHEAESETAVVSLKNCNPEAFQVFLRCVYSCGWENLNEKNVHKVYDIADRYDFLELREACVRHMLSNLTSGSVCSVVDLADKHGENLLMEKATDFLVANARLVFKTNEWRKFEVYNSPIAYDLYTRVYRNDK